MFFPLFFHAFSGTPSRTLLFVIFSRFYAKIDDFGRAEPPEPIVNPSILVVFEVYEEDRKYRENGTQKVMKNR